MIQALSNPAAPGSNLPLPAASAFVRRAGGLGLAGCALGWVVQSLVLATTRPTGLGFVALGLLPLHVGGAAGVCVELLRTSPWRSWAQRCGFGRPTAAAAVRVLGTLLWLGGLVSAVHWASAALCRLVGLESAPSPLLPVLATATGGGVLVAAFVVLLWAPLVEEVFFRFLLPEALAAARVAYAGMWSALVFALAHGVPAYIPGLLLLGLALQHLRRQHGGLWAPILAHGLYNAFSLAGWLYLARPT
jgi:membrane protease YdiL (CAAX protease family)